MIFTKYQAQIRPIGTIDTILPEEQTTWDFIDRPTSQLWAARVAGKLASGYWAKRGILVEVRVVDLKRMEVVA